MARASTIGPEAPSAWTNRATISVSMLGASAQTRLASGEQHEAEEQQGLRPTRSEIGP